MSIVEYEADTTRMKRVKMAGVWFTYYYLPGTDLKSRLQYGGSGSAYYTYEQSRDLLTQVRNHINGGVISQYDYVNDAAGRRTAITRSGSMMSETRTDYYDYNDRNELISAAKNAESAEEYAYQYDDIGNRIESLDLGTNRTYVANALNQYTQISNLCDSASLREEFIPTFDLDGNQTLIQTATGVWQVSYNAENRPVLWECGSTNITMKFDRMGRRVEYVEMVSGVTNTHHRFVYDGYVCIQRLNAASNNAIDLVFGWDPSEPVATRPLILQKYGQYNLFYTHDGNKNVSELVFFQQANGIAAHYEYAPFGAVTATSRSTPVTAYDFREYNPFRFSSEYADDRLELVYYNYRHYNPMDGRWVSKDRVVHNLNSYALIFNAVFASQDSLGLVDQTTIDLMLLALETVTSHHVGLSCKILLPTILDLLDDSTLGFVHSAVNWLFVGKDFELSFDSYDLGWKPGEFESDKYANAIKEVCASGGELSFAANRAVDTYKEGLYAISRLGAPGQYIVSLEGIFSRADDRCRWHFQGKVEIPKDRFDFNVNGGKRSWLGQFITNIVAYMQSSLGIGHDFDITFKGNRQVKDEGDCCE